MNQGLRRFISLLLVFVAAFAVVFLIRNGPDGLRRLLPGGETSNGFRPEEYTLPDKAPLELGDVELLARLNNEYAKLTDAVRPSVVSIDTQGVRSERLLDGFGRQFIRRVPTKGQGSGVIVSQEGHVITNLHVISGQQEIVVTLHDGRTFSATLIGNDPLLDIAVLKISGGGEFEPLKFGDSENVRQGQLVFAIGNPFGLGETVTQGIISARERSISETQPDYLQTDAAINPGNSGGPLVNLRGEIIGINSAIYSPDKRVNSGFQGVGFSIPSNDVKETLEAILERGRPVRGYLGVGMLNLTPDVQSALGYSGAGVGVWTVAADSPAEKAGLRERDVIIGYDGEAIEGTEELINLIQRSRIDEEVEIEVWRDGREMTLDATIAEARPEQAAGGSESSGTAPDARKVLEAVGVAVRDIPSVQQGVVVAEVSPGSLAEGKLRRGDVILSVNGSAVRNSNDFYSQLAASAAAQSTSLQVVRSGSATTVQLPAVE